MPALSEKSDLLAALEARGKGQGPCCVVAGVERGIGRAGVAFWEWAFWQDGDSGASAGNTPDDFVSQSDSSWATVQNATQNVQSFIANQKGALANCIPGRICDRENLDPYLMLTTIYRQQRLQAPGSYSPSERPPSSTHTNAK